MFEQSMTVAAVLQPGEIDGAGQQSGVGHRVAVYPETGDAAVRVDRQPDVGVAVRVADVEGILDCPP